MASEIILKKRFTNKLIKVLVYLEREWSQQAAANFLKKTDYRLRQLSGQPLFLRRVSQRGFVWSGLVVYYFSAESTAYAQSLRETRLRSSIEKLRATN